MLADLDRQRLQTLCSFFSGFQWNRRRLEGGPTFVASNAVRVHLFTREINFGKSHSRNEVPPKKEPSPLCFSVL
jgi:hypothetical protein